MEGRNQRLKALEVRAQSANRIVIRSLWPDNPESEVLWDCSNPAEVADFIATLSIDDGASGGHCMCLGAPTIELWDRERRLLYLSLHHGVRLRSKEIWQGDSELTFDSADRLTTWLANRGIETPRQECIERERASRAAARRRDRIRAILPKAITEAFEKAEEDEEEGIVAAFRSVSLPREKLAADCLRALGCHYGSWRRTVLPDVEGLIARRVLVELGPKAVGNAVRRFTTRDLDPEVAMGAARALFGLGAWDILDRRSLSESLARVTFMGLRHPRQENRWMILRTVSTIPGGEEVLLRVLAGRIEPLEVPAEELEEPDGLVTWERGLPDEPTDVSDRAFAAWLLGRIACTEAWDVIEEYSSSASPQERAVLTQALEMIRQGGVKAPEEAE